MKTKHNCHSGIRLALFVTTICLCFMSQVAMAGTITFYTDRSAWEVDALAAGLTITTEDFSAEPVAFPNISVGSADFSVSQPVPYDAINERIGFTSGGGRVLKLDYTGGSAAVFGFGIDKSLILGGSMAATDIEGVFGNSSTTLGFLGVLGTAALDPANPGLAGVPEYGTSGTAINVYFDNLSVATGASVVPLPPALALMSFGLAGLGLVARRRG